MTTTTYQVTIGERVLRVELRREGERVLVRVDDGDERPVQLGTRARCAALAGARRPPRRGAGRTSTGTRQRLLDGLEFRAEVLDERAHAWRR